MDDYDPEVLLTKAFPGDVSMLATVASEDGLSHAMWPLCHIKWIVPYQMDMVCPAAMLPYQMKMAYSIRCGHGAIFCIK